MNFIESSIKNCYEIQNNICEDNRGILVKPYCQEIINSKGFNFFVKEMYYSKSIKNVIRGLHFQLPPFETAKLVTCIYGKVYDVVLDLREKSPTYLQTYYLILSAKQANMLYIPKGLAHGYCTLSNNSTVLYLSSESYSSEFDSGIKWNSANINWPVNDPIVSAKDNSLVKLNDFLTPF